MTNGIPRGGMLVPTSMIPGGRLAMPNPELVQAVRYGGEGAAHGIDQEIVCSVRHPRDPQWSLVPRGAIEALRLPDRAIVRPTDSASTPLPGDVRLDAELRPYQAQAVEAAVGAQCGGLLVMPPGAGKTVTAMAIVDRLRLRPLVLVHTMDLMDQWVRVACERLGHALDTLGGGGKDLQGSPVGTVAMLQTLWRWSLDDIEALSDRYGVVIADECHHLPSHEIRRVMWGVGCPRRYGLTATPERADGLTPVLHWLMGATLHTVTNQDLQAANVAVRPLVRRVDTQFTHTLKKQARIHGPGARWGKRLKAAEWPTIEAMASKAVSMARAGGRITVSGLTEAACKTLASRARSNGLKCDTQVDTSSLAACYRALVKDPERLAIVRNETAKMLDEGRKVLVIAHRVPYCQAIQEALADAGYPALVLTGKTAKKKRKAGLAAFQAGDVMCCIATTLADEGLDVPDMDGLVLAFPARSAALTTQRAGRTQRKVAGKRDPLVIDIVDSQMGIFVSQWTARRRAYVASGCDIDKA